MRSKKIWYNILTSGTYDKYDISLKSRIIFLNTVMIVAFITLVLFSSLSFYQQNLFLAFPTGGAATLLVIGFFYNRLTHRFIIGSYIASMISFFLFCYLFLSGGIDGSGALWIFSFPLIALFLHQIKIGSLASALMLTIILCGLYIPAIGSYQYSIGYGFRIIGTYVLIYLFSLIYEIVRQKTLENLSSVNNSLIETSNQLSHEKIQTDAVFANVQEGIFLMNSDFVIEPSYSAYLKTLFETDDISKKQLTDLLYPFMNFKNHEALKDYLPMLLDESMNQELIQEINPLEQINLTIPLSDGTVMEKTMEFSFSTVWIETEEVYILTVVRDISEKIALSTQMEAEHHKHQRNMETLFQVLHVEPQLMAEFIEDSEHELDNINAMLKNRDLSINETLLHMYQSIHGTKGNALLLGLEELAITLHNLEQQIQNTIDLDSANWRDILPLTASVGSIQQAFEETRNIIQKLMSFQHASKQAGLSKSGMLERAIRRIVDRESRETGRTAIISFKDIDLLPDHNRRQVRDILVQCIRNSFAHGLDSQEERGNRRKIKDFQLSVRVYSEKNSIVVTYEDDGKGIDLTGLRKKASALPELRIQNPESMSDTDIIRLLFHPGLSTSKNSSLSSGRGMGMSLVHSKIKELNGRIKIANRPEYGLQICLVIPKIETKEPQSA